MIPFSSFEYQAWQVQLNCSLSLALTVSGIVSEMGIIARTEYFRVSCPVASIQRLISPRADE